MTPTTLLRYALILSACIIAGCSKDKNNPAPPPDQHCRIANATATAGASSYTYILNYDNDGRISKVTVDDFNKTRHEYNYAPGLFTRDTYYEHWNGQLAQQLRAEVNSMGLPTLVTEKYYLYSPAGQPPKLNLTVTTSFEYNSKGELQVSTEKRETVGPPANITTTVKTYIWLDGNIVKEETAGVATASFEYYTNKPIQKGDAVNFENLMNNGYSPYNNKNLVKSLTDGTTIINVNYEYDESGKIKTTTLSGSAAASRSIRFQYSCN